MNVQGGPLADFTVKSEFVGYTELVTEASIIAIVQDDRLVERAGAGERCRIILDRTPFYAESGGQVSDTGTISGPGFEAVVEDVAKAPHGQHVHEVVIRSGEARQGAAVVASVSDKLRADIVKNHTATHLLHKALKEVLGEHVNQAGSLVEAERLRFDFSHFGSISEQELAEVERRVNEQIWKQTELKIDYKPLDEAKAMGAMALFGEKYGDIVRVVQVGDYSLELCGGCHVANTAQIGLFKLISESGIGSGIRRIEAVTGRHAYRYVEEQFELLKQSAALLKANVQDVPKRIESLLGQVKEMARENESLTAKLSRLEAGSLAQQVKQVGDVPVLAAKVQASGMEALRTVADQMKEKLPSAVVALGAEQEGKVHLVVTVSPDWVKQGIHAGKLVKELAAVCGGGGGGRPDMAQAGGKDPSKLDEALQLVERLVAEQFA
jgi:alanyl-tRNA synthetase